MATFAGILQYHGNNNLTGNFDLQISYVVADSVALTSFCGITPILSLSAATSSTWYDQITQAVIDDSALQGYTVTSASVRILRHIPGDRPPTCPVRWTFAVTKTNISNSYVNVYVGSNGEAQLVSFTTYAQYRLIVFVNKVGTGTQDAAIVDVTNAANLVSVADTAAAGEHMLDSGWTNLPAWMAGELSLKPMARSTVNTDDPIYRGFALYLR